MTMKITPRTTITTPPRDPVKIGGGRASAEVPIQADMIPVETDGALYVTFAPGKKQAGKWNRDVRVDLERLRAVYGVRVLVTLVEDHELRSLQIPDLVTIAGDLGIVVIRAPIVDAGVSDVDRIRAIVTMIRASLAAGDNVAIHCKGGLGRAGTVAACVLVARGASPAKAMRIVRKHRPGAIENMRQEAFIVSFAADLAKRRAARRVERQRAVMLRAQETRFKPFNDAESLGAMAPIFGGFDDSPGGVR